MPVGPQSFACIASFLPAAALPYCSLLADEGAGSEIGGYFAQAETSGQSWVLPASSGLPDSCMLRSSPHSAEQSFQLQVQNCT